MGLDHKAAEVLARHFDASGEGQVDTSELEAVLRVALAERDADDKLELRAVIGDLQGMMAEYALAGGSKRAMQHASLREMFAEFDADGSNSITYEELVVMLVRMELTFNPRVQRMLCLRFDEDGDGAVDWLEFVRFVEAGGEAGSKAVSLAVEALVDVVEEAGDDARAVFEMLDLTGSGRVTRTELVRRREKCRTPTRKTPSDVLAKKMRKNKKIETLPEK